MTEHVNASDSWCPVCGHPENEIVDAHIEGRGSSTTLAIKACKKCEILWGERKEWCGVREVDGQSNSDEGDSDV